MWKPVVRTLAAATILAGLISAQAIAAPKKINPEGVGGVRLGARYTTLHARGLIGKIAPGCEFGGPNTRSAKLRPPLKGSVDFTLSSPRRVQTISISGGAAARGVSVGSTVRTLKAAYPSAKFDHSTDRIYGATFVRVGKKGGGPLAFSVGTKTKKVELIGIPNLAICD